MPRWARFLSCSFTGLLLSLSGFLFSAAWWEGGTRFWPSLLLFVAQPGFWYLTSLFWLLAGLTLLTARLSANLYELPGSVAGLGAGVLTAIGLAAFLTAVHAAEWGGWGVSLRKAWPGLLVFVLPFAVTGGVTSWLWDRLD